jgi:hypothetical protein
VTFQGPNQDSTYIAPQDRASLQPSDWVNRAGPAQIKRDKNMPWVPDVFNDATEWIQRAGMGDEEAIKEVCLTVAPALLQEVRRLRDEGSK